VWLTELSATASSIRLRALGSSGRPLREAAPRAARARESDRKDKREQVFLHRQVLEDVPSFHDLHNPAPHDLGRILSPDALAHEFDAALCHVAALGPEEAWDSLERRALAGAVRPEEGDQIDKWRLIRPRLSAEGRRHSWWEVLTR
jgi:hypothetical protein